MPSLERRHRYQAAVLWAKSGDDVNAEPTFSAAIEIRVRWVKGRVETVNAQGNTISLDAQVVVDREIKVGSKMWLGPLADWYGTGSAGPDTEVLWVVNYHETPDVKARFAERSVDLSRFRDA